MRRIPERRRARGGARRVVRLRSDTRPRQMNSRDIHDDRRRSRPIQFSSRLAASHHVLRNETQGPLPLPRPRYGTTVRRALRDVSVPSQRPRTVHRHIANQHHPHLRHRCGRPRSSVRPFAAVQPLVPAVDRQREVHDLQPHVRVKARIGRGPNKGRRSPTLWANSNIHAARSLGSRSPTPNRRQRRARGESSSACAVQPTTERFDVSARA